MRAYIESGGVADNIISCRTLRRYEESLFKVYRMQQITQGLVEFAKVSAFYEKGSYTNHVECFLDIFYLHPLLDSFTK